MLGFLSEFICVYIYIYSTVLFLFLFFAIFNQFSYILLSFFWVLSSTNFLKIHLLI